MSCDCSPESKKTYYATIQLFTSSQDGIPGGSAPPLNMQEVVVCTKCGAAEFSIPASARRLFQVAS